MRTSSHSIWTTLGLIVLSGCTALPVTAREPAGVKRLETSLGIARLCETQGDTEKARQLYTKISEQFPKCPDTHHRLGVMAGKDGNLDEATAHFDKAVQLRPNDTEILTDRSYVHYLATRYDQAEADARAALRLSSKNKRAAVNLALTLGSTGRMDEAYQAFKAAVGESEAASNIAYLHAQQGDIEKAKAWYARALEHDRENRRAAEALVQLHKVERQAILAARRAQSTKAVASETKQSEIIQTSAQSPAPPRRKASAVRQTPKP